MNGTAFPQKALSLFTALGGWRTLAEAVVSRALFLVVYLLTGHVVTSALVAVGGVAVFAVVRVCTHRKYWQAIAALVMVGVSALLAGTTGRGVDFYLPSILFPAAGGTVCLLSMLVRFPAIGMLVGPLRAQRFGWRRDRELRRRYQGCTAVFLAKFGISVSVMAPLYLSEHLIALGIAATLLGTPLTALCTYLCWRILREPRPTGTCPQRRHRGGWITGR
jgi:uncharacterized membrane protein